MTWRVLPIVLVFCLLFFAYGEGNESHTELKRAKLDSASMTGPEAVHRDEAAVSGLELKYHNPDIMLMNYRPRLRRHAEKKKKKKKHNAGAFSPLSMAQDGKTTHNSRTKRHETSKGKKIKLAKQPLKRLKPRHEQKSPKERTKAPKKKQVKKPQPPGVLSVLSYTTRDKEGFV